VPATPPWLLTSSPPPTPRRAEDHWELEMHCGIGRGQGSGFKSCGGS
jgi:hypothetical protein